jgi:hypothetical protein
MVLAEVKFEVTEEKGWARSIIVTDINTGEARASAKTRELADLALVLLTL